MASCDAQGSVRCEENVESLATSDVYPDGSNERTRPMTSEYRTRKHEQVSDLNKNSSQRRVDNSDQSARDGSQSNDKIIKAHGSVNENSRDVKSKKIQNNLRLKIVIYWRYLEDRGCPRLSRFKVARVFLPCKPSDLMKRIFTADPSLTESCLIVMRRKFEFGIHNVCSCLNDVLGSVDAAFVRRSRLDCKICFGYISFRLKIGGAGKKYLFVMRVPICQNVRKRAIRRNFPSEGQTEKSSCFVYKDNDNNDDALACLGEKSERLDDIRCLKSHCNLVKDATIRASQNKREIVRANIEDIPKHEDITISCCGKSCESIVEEISDIMLRTNNPEGKNAEYRKSLNSRENDRDAKKRGEEVVDSSIVKNDESTRSVNNINRQCWSRDNFLATNDKTDEIFSTKNLDGFSQIANIDECDCTCPSESNQIEDCNANTCSIASFVQNSERDKQLVELNCNRLLNDSAKAIDERPENDSASDSAKTEVECGSSCSCRYTDFIDITVVDNISEESIVRAREISTDSLEIPSANYSRTLLSGHYYRNDHATSVRTPKLRISSKDIDMDVSCSRTIIWLASGDDGTVSTVAKIRDSRDAFSSNRALIVPKKGRQILDGTNFRVSNRARNFIRTTDKLFTLEGTRSSDTSTNYFCVKNHIASGVSRKSRKLKKSKCRCSSHGIDDATSATILKYRAMSRRYRDDDDFVDARTLMMTNFRDSVDRSIEGIKYLRAKLGKVLFKNRVRTKRN